MGGGKKINRIPIAPADLIKNIFAGITGKVTDENEQPVKTYRLL